MKSQIRLIRAVGGEFLARKYKSLLLASVIISALLLALSVWLTTVNVWWWIFAVVVIVFIILGIVITIAGWIILGVLRPELTREQKTATGRFVDKLERVAENLQMPMFMIIFKVALDIIRPKEKTFIKTVAEDSTTLHEDFIQLSKFFAD